MKKTQNYIVDEETQKYFIKRFNIIIGQINGLSKMIQDKRSYEEVLIQLSALTNSLKTVGQNILADYIKNNFMYEDKDVDEIIKLMNKLV